jgi:F420-dependent oxidoreductase-like protein
MRVAEFIGVDVVSVSQAHERVAAANEHGFDGVWFAQGLSLDALSTIAVVGALVPGISLGTAVVPIQGRHPLPLALAARTAVSAAGRDRISLGIGVTHRVVSEGFFGISYDGIVTSCEETIHALDQFFSKDQAAHIEGETLTARAQLVGEIAPPSLLVAALGKKMLALAGACANGTITWMTGPKTISTFIRPILDERARAANRSVPKVLAGLPVCITNNANSARDSINDAMSGAAALPSYARMLKQEGVARPVDIALVGSEEEVAESLGKLKSAGVDELIANIVGSPEEQANTRAVLARLPR